MSAEEIQFSPEDLIISKTDVHGNITYANRLFMRVCNFSEDELLQNPHNLIRHSDMPKGVFHGMWETLKSGNEFFGFIKNTTSDGNFYWVFANVTPDFSAGKIVGYYSVRRYAPRAALPEIEKLYRQMMLEEQSGMKPAGKRSWEWLNKYCTEQTGLPYEAYVLTHYQKYK